MISIGSYPNDFLPDKFDEIWLITRSVRSVEEQIKPYKNVYHVTELSPSPNLFDYFKTMSKQGKWNQNTFDTVYVPQFLHELSTNPDGIAKLEQLCVDSYNKNICLLCFCLIEKCCHRSIVNGILFNMGADIQCAPMYQKYILTNTRKDINLRVIKNE